MGKETHVTLAPDHPLVVGYTARGVWRELGGPILSYCAYLPDRIRELRAPSERALAECERASKFVSMAAERHAKSDVANAVAQLLMYIEAVSTASAEHYPTSCTKMLDYAAVVASGCVCPRGGNEAVALDAVDALREFVAGPHEAVTFADLCDVNATFTRSNRHADLSGRLRDRPVWIGGRTLFEARFVPPPEAVLEEYVYDLVQSLNDDAWPFDPVAKAALAHLQLVTIHPFVDGNGRVGRALWLQMLQRGGLAGGLVLPATAALLTRMPRYIGTLNKARSTDGPADPSEFVELAAWCCGIAGDRVMRVERSIANLLSGWARRISARDVVAEKAITAFASTPIMTETMLAEELSCDVRPVLDDMVEADILQRRMSAFCDVDVYVSHEVVSVLEFVQTMRGMPVQVDWDV